MTQNLLDRYQRTMTNMFGTPARALVKGEGVYVWDADGKRYTDFLAGIAVNALGHAHPALVEALTEQAKTLGHISNLFTSLPQVKLAERLTALAGAADGACFFANSGTEANEAAFKLARRHSHAAGGTRPKVIALKNAFHGRTMGALALTWKPQYREPFEPLPGGVEFVPAGDIDALYAEMDDTVAAVIIEPVQGEAGVRDFPTDYLRQVRQACDDHGALLIFDEIQLAELAEELSRLDSELNLRVTAQHVQIQTLEERLEQSRQAASRPAPARQTPRPAAPPSPPFQVTGVESRGGRPYVGVSPNGLSSLRDIRLLGVGDRQDGWELTSIRGTHAVFSRNGRSVDVQIP